VEPIHPRWSTWTFLVYASGLTTLVALEGWWTYFASTWGAGGFTAASLGLFAVAALVALVLLRTEHRVSAGVFAFVAVAAFVAFLSALWKWLGWNGASNTDTFAGFHVTRLLLVLLWLVVALVALAVFRFPLLLVQVIFAGWLFVTDFVSNGGGWSAVVTLFLGICLLGAAVAFDDGPSRVYGFWLHVGAGVLIGGSLLWFWHGGNVDWALIAIVAVLFIAFADVVGRSSWAVLGTVGLLMAATHFTLAWTRIQLFFFNSGNETVRGWVPPLVLTCTAFVLLVLGLRSGRTATT